jgi:outer membrane protein
MRNGNYHADELIHYGIPLLIKAPLGVWGKVVYHPHPLFAIFACAFIEREVKIHVHSLLSTLTSLVLAFFLAGNVSAQKKDTTVAQPWTMEQCVNYAWSHNLQVKQAQLNEEIAKNNLLQSKANVLPSITGFASRTFNYGLSINPFTNTFANSEVTEDDYALSGSLTIFGGLQNLNTIKQNNLNYEASGYDLQTNKNNIALNIAQDYLQVLLDKELLSEAQQQQAVSQQEVDRTQKLYDAGSVAKSNLLDIESQESNDEVNAINAQNSLDVASLSLAQLLDMDSVSAFSIATPEISIPENPNLDNPEMVYTKALTNQPDVKSAEVKWESSVRSADVAKGGLYPKLVLSGSVGTGYSTANTSIVGTNVSSVDTIHTTITGVDVLYPNYSYVTKIVPYSKQLDNNVNKSFGFRLTIPIFNGLQANIAAQNAKLTEQNAYYTYQTAQLNLHKTIQQAYADAYGALKKYHAEERAVESLKESFNYAQSKFDVGMATSLDYNTAKTNLARAESDLLQAKYNYVFKVKVLDFYEGKPLKL